MTYRLVDVDPNDPDDGRRLAALFDAFDSAWPGGFGRGIRHTAEGIRSYLGRARRSMILAVEHDGEFVGYCDVLPFPGDAERAYVDLLGASPAHHGRGVGKMLLLEALRRSIEAGVRQVTLHTWPGNTKAVPLYKKTGFQWAPDTDVHMRNFIPTVLAMPAARTFLGADDWYALQERELELAPDDVRWRGTPVYEYRFRRGDDFLRVWIDRASEEPTAVETPRYLVGCSVPVEDAPAGEPCPVEWTIRASGDEELAVAVAAHGGAGVDVELHEQLHVRGETTIRREIRIAADAEPDRVGDPPHVVRTTVRVGDDLVELATGIRVVRPVEIAVDRSPLQVGRPQRTRLTLRSRLDRDIDGTVSLSAGPRVSIEPGASPVRLPARSRTQVRPVVVASEGGAHRLTVALDAGGVRLRRDATLHAFPGDGPLVTIDEHEQIAVLAGPSLRLEADLRGGLVHVVAAGSGRVVVDLPPSEVGPPFSVYRVRPDLYRASHEMRGGVPTLVLARPSNEIDGLLVERRLSFVADDLVRVEQRIASVVASPLAVSVRQSLGRELDGHLAFPSAAGLVREPLLGWGHFPVGPLDAMPAGRRFAESWCAADDGGRVVGLIWDGADEEQFGWGGAMPTVTHDLGEVPGNGAVEAPPLWIVAGPGSWEVVRDWWRRLVRPDGDSDPSPVVPRRVLEIRTEPSPAVLGPDDRSVRVSVTSLRGKETEGEIEIGEPPTSIVVPPIDVDHPFTAEVALGSDGGPFAKVLRGTARLEGLAHPVDLPVLRLGGPGVVDVSEADGLVLIDNGTIRMKVAPRHGGSVTSLEWSGKERLISSFPTPRPFVWSGRWFGGIHPNLRWIGAPLLADESFTGGPVRRTDRHGAVWAGAQVVCDPAHRDRRWLRLEVDYLTLPASAVLLVATRWTNRTSARATIEPEPCLAVWLAPIGADGGEALWVGCGARRSQRATRFSRDMTSDSWAAVADAVTGEAALLVPGGRDARAWIEDMAESGRHLGARLPGSLDPGQTLETLAWLVMCRGDEIDAYAALRDYEPWATPAPVVEGDQQAAAGPVAEGDQQVAAPTA